MQIEDRDGPRVLLVEDSLDEGELLQMALSDQGFQVFHVLSAEEALSGLARLKGRDLPQVIVFDLRLPGMGGAELCRALGENPAWQLIPRVLMTGKPLAPYEEQALGAAETFQKPLDVLALAAGLRRLVEHRSLLTVA
ncbi:MAG TPA: response regulator [Myxococcaceae bacterium]|nr:response regulator [Myxococcaceae bacterium]